MMVSWVLLRFVLARAERHSVDVRMLVPVQLLGGNCDASAGEAACARTVPCALEYFLERFYAVCVRKGRAMPA